MKWGALECKNFLLEGPDKGLAFYNQYYFALLRKSQWCSLLDILKSGNADFLAGMS